MAYITTDDMIAAFGSDEMSQLLDVDNSGAYNLEALGAAIGFACNVIDKQLAKFISTPLLYPDQQLKSYACDIARTRLYTSSIPEHVSDRGDKASHWVESIGLYEAQMIDLSSSTSAKFAVYRANEPVFTAESMRLY